MKQTLLWIAAAGCLVGAFAGCSRVPSKDEENGNRLLRSAGSLMDRGLFSPARDSATRALEFFRNANADDGVGTAEQTLGDIESAEAGFDKALEYFAASTGHYRSAGDKIGIRAVTLSVMDIYTRMGLEEEALNRGQEALRLAHVSRDKEAIEEFGAALLPLARTLNNRDLEDQLIDDQQRDADSTGDRKRLCWIRDQMGLRSLGRGDAVTAVQRFIEARDTAEQAGDTARAVPILIHLARAYEASGNLPDALSTYIAALPLAERSHADLLQRQEIFFRTGNALLSAKRNAEAVGYFQSALGISRERGDELARRYAMLQLANALRLVDLAAALPIVRQALEGLDDGAPPALLAYAYGTDGLCALAANQPVDALASFQRAADATEREWSHTGNDLYADCRRTVVGPGRTPWHDEEIDLLTRMGRNDDALTVALRRSGWLLFRDLDRIRPIVGDASLQAMIDRWHLVRARCNGAEEQLNRSWSSSAGAREQAALVSRVLTETGSEARSLSADIIAARRSIGSYVSPRSVSGQELKRMLPDGTILILYLASSRSLEAFVVGRQVFSVHSVSIARPLLAARCSSFADQLRLLATSVDSLTEYKPKQIAQALTDQASALYEIAVRPIERDIAQARTLLIAEGNDIPFLPVSVLRRGGSAGTSLLERYPVAYVYPSVLVSGSMNDPIINRVVAFGSSGTSGRDAEYELRDIKVTFKDAAFHFDPRASLTELNGEQADLAHLAFDVHWDGLRPANSYVSMFDPTSEVIKKRPVGELVEMPAFPAVVVYNLSTDASIAAGQLAMLPIGAGSKIVIMNCAGTGRKSTKSFVDAFSTELRGAKGVSEAYRSALLGIIRRPDVLPVFWMPFVLWMNP